MNLIVAALILSIVFLTGLIVWAWRGKRIDDHPLCRRCGFDLSGKSPESPQCPECGRDLSAAGAIVVGNRKRRLGIFAAGLAAQFVLSLLIASAGYGYLTSARYFRLFPTPWLMMIGSQNDDTNLRGGALRELIDRAATGKLTRDEVQTMIGRLLDRQATSASWNSSWSDLFVKLNSSGLLENAEWSRFASHYATATITARHQINVGAPLPAEILIATRGDYPSLLIGYDITWRDDQSGLVFDTQNSGAFLTSAGSRYCTVSAKSVDALPAGVHALTAEVVIRVYSRDSPTIVAGQHIDRIPLTVRILPQTQPVIEPIADADLNEATRQLFQRPLVMSRPVASDSRRTVDSIQFRFSKSLPADVAFRCKMVDGDKTLREFSLRGKKGDGSLGDFLGQNVVFGRGPLPDFVDVILIPSLDVASESVSMTSYANVAMTFKKVQVARNNPEYSRGRPSSRPTSQPTP